MGEGKRQQRENVAKDLIVYGWAYIFILESLCGTF